MKRTTASYGNTVRVGVARKRVLRRMWFLYIIAALLALSTTLAVAKINALQDLLQLKDDSLYRTQKEMVAGARRFVDYIYSLNGATIYKDQYYALNMIVDTDKRQHRLDYLRTHEVVRKAQSLNTRSRIEWDKAKTEILSVTGNSLVVSVFVYQNYNEQSRYPLQVHLTVIPVAKSDTNSEGVGVVGWTDLAKTPFAGEEHRDNDVDSSGETP